MTAQELRERATRRAEAKLGFYIHAVVYIAVNSVLAFLNLSGEHQRLWFVWPLAGWGIGVLFHGLNVFVFTGQTSLKDRMIDRELARQRKQHPTA